MGRTPQSSRSGETAVTGLARTDGNGLNGNGSKYSIDEIELIVRNGAPAGANRSDVFHGIVGHYVGCGWSVEQIAEHLQQFPTELAAATSASTDCTMRLSGAPASTHSEHCRSLMAMAAG